MCYWDYVADVGWLSIWGFDNHRLLHMWLILAGKLCFSTYIVKVSSSMERFQDNQEVIGLKSLGWLHEILVLTANILR